MKKLILIIAIVFSGMLMQAQTTKYFDNYKALDVNGQTIINFTTALKECKVEIEEFGIKVYTNVGGFKTTNHYIFKNEWSNQTVTKWGKDYIYIEAWSEYANNIIFYDDRKILIYNKAHKEYEAYYNLNDANQPTVLYAKTELDKLPKNVRFTVAEKYHAAKKAALIRERKKEAHRLKEKAIKSKIYDLAKFDTNTYNMLYNLQVVVIIETIQSQLTYDYLKEKKMSFGSYNNTYSIYYRHSNGNKDFSDRIKYDLSYGKSISGQLSEPKLLIGTDSSCMLIEYSLLNLPTISIDGIEAKTEMFIDSLTVKYILGMTEVKVKNGQASYRKDEPPITEVHDSILEELNRKTTGKYIVYYEYGVIGNKKIKNTIVKLKQ